jgi:hypothetical protein
MRARALALAGALSVASFACVVGLAEGCSSTTSTSSGGNVDVPLGPGQALGTPCDPSLVAPCETLTDVCSVAVCDPTSRRCERVTVDGGPTCGNGVPPGADAGDSADAKVEKDASDLDAPDAETPDGSADGEVSEASTRDGALEASSDAGDASDAEAAGDVGAE